MMFDAFIIVTEHLKTNKLLSIILFYFIYNYRTPINITGYMYGK